MTAARTALDALLRSVPALGRGHVWLVGAGPGDPRLLTLEAVGGLAQADVVVHDALVSPAVLDLAPAAAERVFAGKRGGKPSAVQDDITLTLVARARAGRRVVRLKGGDPFVFGRGGEEAAALAGAGIPFRVVPGVTAGIGGLAVAGIPATMRHLNQAVILATGHGADTADGLDWAALAATGQPIVLYMAMRNIGPIAAALMAGGLAASTPAAVVVSATLPEERVLVTTLSRLAEDAAAGGFGAPAVVAIGEIVRMRATLLQAARAAEGAA